MAVLDYRDFTYNIEGTKREAGTKRRSNLRIESMESGNEAGHRVALSVWVRTGSAALVYEKRE
jgi:hypothetical protein